MREPFDEVSQAIGVHFEIIHFIEKDIFEADGSFGS